MSKEREIEAGRKYDEMMIAPSSGLLFSGDKRVVQYEHSMEAVILSCPWMTVKIWTSTQHYPFMNDELQCSRLVWVSLSSPSY